MTDTIRETLAVEPKPQLNPFFSARVVANFPKPHVRRWLVAYWIAAALVFITILARHPIRIPVWTLYVLLPAALAAAIWLAPARRSGRWR